jgi:ABC-2 type transport system permease protein
LEERFLALGMLIGVISGGARATVLWAQMIFLPSMLLGGLMMPLDVLLAVQAYLGLVYG